MYWAHTEHSYSINQRVARQRTLPYEDLADQLEVFECLFPVRTTGDHISDHVRGQVDRPGVQAVRMRPDMPTLYQHTHRQLPYVR